MSNLRVMVLGIGSFAHAVTKVFKEHGAEVCTYLTRDYGHYGPSLEGKTYSFQDHASPIEIIKDNKIDLLVPMSIDWFLKPWTQDVIALGVPIFCPQGEAINLERKRDLSRALCDQYDIPFPKSYAVANLQEAKAVLEKDRRAYVIKNPLCSPTSPVHTIVCETWDETAEWLPRLNYSEGVFLQEYAGRAEVGHIAVVSHGKISSIVTNQEYKRAFNGNMGVVAGAPLGGLVEKDPEDKYGLAKELLHPLLPWFKKVNFHGPVQVTAAKHRGRWHVLEYNVRFGITSTQMILRLLKNPIEVFYNTARNQKVEPVFFEHLSSGASITLAGYGYPYVVMDGPRLPVRITDEPTCDIWWNEVAKGSSSQIAMTGHRLADIVAVSDSIPSALSIAYDNIRNINCLSSYYRTDIGESLWPPGES